MILHQNNGLKKESLASLEYKNLSYKYVISKIVFSVLLIIIFLTGCSSQMPAESKTNGKSIYVLNKERTTLLTIPYTGSEENILEDMIAQLGEYPDNIELKAPLQMDFSLLDYYKEGNQIVLSVDEKYQELIPTDEILVRAALVRTLTQIDGVDYVRMTVHGEPLMDRSGNPVGVMNADSFVDNEGVEINAYEKTNIHLYFASEDGLMLKDVIRQVEYNSNISLEKVVLEQLIAGITDGTREENVYPTMNSMTKINSVTVADGVCYVDFNSAFLQQPYSVSPEVTIYSIVNSLSELSYVNKVQISIEGDSNLVYREKMNLNTVFERNLDMVIK